MEVLEGDGIFGHLLLGYVKYKQMLEITVPVTPATMVSSRNLLEMTSFFCESAVTSSDPVPRQLFPDDVLWDGQDCTSTSTCCQFNNPPWFTKNLPTETTDDIELRICTSATTSAEDTPLELIELYIQ